MREHELELIVDLVEGRLQDETEARALIASSPELQKEYETQKAVFTDLRSVEPATLTEAERAALHRDVWASWRSESAPAPAQPPWYYRWVSVTAGLLVVIGLLAVLNQGSQEGVTETFSEFGSSLDGDSGVVSTTAAATASATQPSGGEGGTDNQGEAATDGGSVAVPTEEDLARELTAPETAYYSAQVDEVRSGDPEVTMFDEGQAPQNLADCVETAGLKGFDVVATVTPNQADQGSDTTSGGDQTTSTPPAPQSVTTFIIAIPSESDADEALVAIVELEGCELVYFEE